VGTADALALTLAGLFAWAAFASTVQVLVYRRGLTAWAASEQQQREEAPPARWQGNVAENATNPCRPGRFDPRAVAAGAFIAFVLLLSSTEWAVLAAVAGWLALAWALSRPERDPLPAGLVFAGLLAGGAFVFALGGGLGLETALRRAARAALLVLVATWLRAAARAPGLREVSRRVLGRLRRIPSLPEASEVLDAIASEGRLAAAGRSLTARLSEAPKRPMALLDAVLAWVVREADGYVPPPPAAPLRLRVRPPDWALLVSAAALVVALEPFRAAVGG